MQTIQLFKRTINEKSKNVLGLFHCIKKYYLAISKIIKSSKQIIIC